MSIALHVDPVVGIIDAISSWSWRQVLELSNTWMERFVFHPLIWPSVVTEFYNVSRDLSWSLIGIITILVAMRSLWPQLTGPWSRLAVPTFLERLVVAALIDLAGLGVVQSALKINNALV